jgi:hypothetical protein
MFRFSVRAKSPKDPRYSETVKLAEMILFLFICVCVHPKVLADPNPKDFFFHFPYPLCITNRSL